MGLSCWRQKNEKSVNTHLYFSSSGFQVGTRSFQFSLFNSSQRIPTSWPKKWVPTLLAHQGVGWRKLKLMSVGICRFSHLCNSNSPNELGLFLRDRHNQSFTQLWLGRTPQRIWVDLLLHLGSNLLSDSSCLVKKSNPGIVYCQQVQKAPLNHEK